MNPAFAGPMDPHAPPAMITIPVEKFVRTRDGVVTGLTNLIGVMNELIRSYLQHTNSMLGENTAPTDLQLNMSNLFSNAVTGLPIAEGPVGKKKKHARKPKDPNAPKRPLTAFFLYSTQARKHVKESMPNATAKEVNEAILHRWNTMDDKEKAKWKEIYEANANRYRADVAEYKARTGSQLVADDDDAPGEVDYPVAAGATFLAAPLAAEDSDSSDDSDAPAPAPPPKKAVKRKSKADAASAQLLAEGATPGKKDKKRKDGPADAEGPKKKAKKATDPTGASPAMPKKEKKKKKSDVV